LNYKVRARLQNFVRRKVKACANFLNSIHVGPARARPGSFEGYRRFMLIKTKLEGP
jgi:hypothetical protein